MASNVQEELGDDLYFPINRRSIVWKHFQLSRKEKNKAFCTHCTETVGLSGDASTSAMAKHLKRRHKELDLNQQQTVRSSSAKSSQNSDEEQPSVLQMLMKDNYAVDHPKAISITGQIALMIVKDQQPISLLEDKGFVDLIKYLAPRYNVVSRRHMTETVIPKLYSYVKKAIKGMIKECRGVAGIAFTTDGWTSRSNTSYLTLTVHLIDQSWNLKAFVLTTEEVRESHTADNLAQILSSTIKSWLPSDALYTTKSSIDLPGVSPAITTDNAANIVKGK